MTAVSLLQLELELLVRHRLQGVIEVLRVHVVAGRHGDEAGAAVVGEVDEDLVLARALQHGLPLCRKFYSAIVEPARSTMPSGQYFASWSMGHG